MDDEIDEQYFPLTFAQSFVRIYKTLWNVVRCSDVLRYFCARASFTERVKMQWVQSDGRVNEERPVSLRYSLHSNRIRTGYYGEVSRYFPDVVMTRDDMLLVFLIVVHSNFEFDKVVGAPIKKVEKEPVTWVRDLQLAPEMYGGLVSRLIKSGLPAMSDVKLNSQIFTCSKCNCRKSFCYYRAKQRSLGVKRICVRCEKGRKMERPRQFVLANPDEPVQYHSRFSGAVYDASLDCYTIAINLSAVSPFMDPPLVSPDLVGDPKLSRAYFVPGAHWEIYLENGNSQPVEVSSHAFFRRRGARNVYGPFRRLEDIELEQEVLTPRQLSMHYGFTKQVLGSKNANNSATIKGQLNDSHTGDLRSPFASSGPLAYYWSVWLTLIVVGVVRQPLSDLLMFNVSLTQSVCYCMKGIDKMLD